jgi:hypothetical protein
VAFATTPVTPVVRRATVDLGDGDEDDEADYEQEDPELSLQEQAVAAAQAVLTGSEAASSKRDKQPQPLSFWTGRIDEPAGMGRIGGGNNSFIGETFELTE